MQARALGDALAQSVVFPRDLMTLEDNLSSKMASLESRLEARIETGRLELGGKIETLKFELGGKIETLKWMFGVLVALNVGIFIRLLLVH